MKDSIHIPTVSIIMNCYNGSEYLREAIDSIYLQTFLDWEIIFWDNASTDNSDEIALSYDKRIKYFRAKKTTPLGKARNLAIQKAKGEYVAFLDCDDVWLPNKLEDQLKLFRNRDEIGLVFSNCFKLYWPSNHCEDRFECLEFGPHKGHVLDKLFMENFIPMLTVMVKKSILIEAGGFYEELNVGTDYDLWLRIVQKYQIDYFSAPLAKYRIHDNSVTNLNNVIACKEHIRVLKRCLFRNPSLKSILGNKVDKRISYKYVDLSSVYLKRFNISRSLDMFFKAIKTYPLSVFFFIKKLKSLGYRKII